MMRKLEGWRPLLAVAPVAAVAAAGVFNLLAMQPLAAAPQAAAPPPAAGLPAADSGPDEAPPPAALTGQASEYDAGEYVGPATCASANCHGNSEPTTTYDILQTEFPIWFYQDPHRGAWEVLLDEESQLIARNLRLERPAHATPACLECHTLFVPESRQAVALEREDGISCEGCHGPAGGWLARHNESGWSHEDSVAAGLVELGDVETRATVCLSCHLGDVSQQVDHQLIAAGHPELVFELDNYTEAMPPHWLPIADKRQAERRIDTHGVRAWAAGQAHSFHDGLGLLADRASSQRWPEFAEMSCDSCHHDLAGGEWRQLRGYRYTAGLPPWSPARWVVLRHLVAEVAAGELGALDAAVEGVAAAVADLWGPKERTAARARAAAEQLGRVVPRIEAADWSRARVRRLLLALAAERQGLRDADRQSAEQIALAVQSLTAYLTGQQPAQAAGPLADAVNDLFAELERPYEWDRDRFGEALGRVEASLQ